MCWRLRNRFLAHQKRVCKAGVKGSLKKKETVVRITSVKAAVEAYAFSMELLAATGVGITPSEPKQRWFHIGQHSFTPYKSTFFELDPNSDPTRSVNFADEVLLQVPGTETIIITRVVV